MYYPSDNTAGNRFIVNKLLVDNNYLYFLLSSSSLEASIAKGKLISFHCYTSIYNIIFLIKMYFETASSRAIKTYFHCFIIIRKLQKECIKRGKSFYIK